MQNSSQRVFGNISKPILAVALILLGFLVLWRFELNSDVTDELKKIAAARLPASGVELNAWRRPVSDNENGALILTQAFSLKRAFPDKRSLQVDSVGLLERTNIWTPETTALVSEYIQMNKECLDKVRDALLLPHYRYPADFAFGPQTPLPHLRSLKELAHIIALQTHLKTIDGGLNDWPGSVELILQLASTLDEEPSALSQLVRYAIIRVAVRSVETSLNMGISNPETLARLQDKFVALGKTNFLQLSLIGERACSIPVFRMSMEEIRPLDNSDSESDPDRQPRRLSGKGNLVMRATGFFERDLSFYLKTMDKAIALSSAPLPKCLELTNLFKTSGEIASDKFFVFSKLILPSLGSSVVREAYTQAHIELAQIALALEQFHEKSGKLPSQLSELAPQFLNLIPSDPFTGQPFKYRQLPKGYVVYSVDRDGLDDGGRETPLRKKINDKSTYDITFTVERQPKK